jgi:hypothetical protein
MPLCAADIQSLTLLIQRLLDAELLPDAEGEALLAETDAARRSLEQAEAETARRQLERLARLAEALVETSALDPADGQGVIRTARRIAAGDPG